MNAVPSVTVVIPAYRAARTIRRAVESVLQQTVLPTQVIVVDDGSPDRVELAAAVSPLGRAVTLLTKPNGGASSARNYGIDHAQSDWVAFLDADDYWEPTKLERQLAVAHSHPEVMMVGCRWYEQEPGTPRRPAALLTVPYSGRVLRPRGRQAFEIALTVWTGSLLVRRSALRDTRFVSGLEPAEDRDLWVRLIAAHPSYILPDLLATYVQEPGGISRSDVDRDCGNMLRVVRRHAALLGTAGIRAQEAVVYRRWASVHLAQGRPEKAVPHAFRRLKLQPGSLQAWWIAAKATIMHLTRRFNVRLR